MQEFKTWDEQIRFLFKRNHQLRNEVKLWSDFVIYCRDMMLVIMKCDGSLKKICINCNMNQHWLTNILLLLKANYDKMAFMIHKLFSKIEKYNSVHIAQLYEC